VTGAARGIGKGIAVALSQCGAEVYALSKTQENLDQLVAEYPTIHPVCVDVSDWSATRKAVEALPPIDLLVNNAGIAKNVTLFDVDLETFDNLMNVNLKAALNISQVVGKSLISRGKPGSIVNISSICGMIVLPAVGPYCVTKAALNMLTKVLAVDLGPHKIRVNSVNPTGAMTDMGKAAFYNDKLKDAMTSKTPLGRFAEVSEFVNPVLYLLSDDASMVHGITMLIDGGYTLQ